MHRRTLKTPRKRSYHKLSFLVWCSGCSAVCSVLSPSFLPVSGCFRLLCSHIFKLLKICYDLWSRHPTLSSKALCFRASIRRVRPFVVWTDLVTTISHERLEQSRWILQRITNSSYWWPCEMLEVKGQAGRGEGIHRGPRHFILDNKLRVYGQIFIPIETGNSAA